MDGVCKVAGFAKKMSKELGSLWENLFSPAD
jgi:hypothetical protein